MNAYCFCIVFAIGAPALKEKSREPTIVGEWVAQETTAGGWPTKAKVEDVLWVFKADGARKIRREGKLAFSGEFVDDPNATPATHDLDRNPKGEAVYLCIYRIDGDTLTFIVGWQKVARPSEFKSPEGSQYTVYVFKRVKAKD